MATPRKDPADYVKTGRPTKYRPEYCDLVVSMGKVGDSKAKMAIACDVCRTETLDEWAEQFPEFSAALARARLESLSWWEELGKQGATGTMPVQPALWSRNMAARFPAEYTERKQTELSGKDGGPVELSHRLENYSDEELDRRIGAAMKAANLGTT